MKAENCYVGMRIYVPSIFWGNVDFKGRRGTVVFIDGSDVGVDFDDEISSFTYENGHTCSGRARNGHGFYGDVRDIEPEPLPPAIDLDNIEITFEDVFGGDKT